MSGWVCVTLDCEPGAGAALLAATLHTVMGGSVAQVLRPTDPKWRSQRGNAALGSAVGGPQGTVSGSSQRQAGN